MKKRERRSNIKAVWKNIKKGRGNGNFGDDNQDLKKKVDGDWGRI